MGGLMSDVRVYFTTCTYSRREAIFFANVENHLLNEEDATEDFSLSDLEVDIRRLALNDELRSAYETKDIIPAGKNVVILGSQFKPPGYGLTPYKVKEVRTISEGIFKDIVQMYAKQRNEYSKKKEEIHKVAELRIKQVEEDIRKAERTLPQPDLQSIVYQTLATK